VLVTCFRSRAEKALPPHGLCFAGVGYDDKDLAFYKYMPKQKRLELEQEFGRPAPR
jgi:hypothetical protein